MYGLKLQPLARSLARVVETCRPLGDHALFVRSLCLGELASAELGDMLTVAHEGIARQDSFKNAFALKQRLVADVPAIYEQCVENHIE